MKRNSLPAPFITPQTKMLILSEQSDEQMTEHDEAACGEAVCVENGSLSSNRSRGNITSEMKPFRDFEMQRNLEIFFRCNTNTATGFRANSEQNGQ